ncbi:hypothetical protein MKZ38_002926 [Zalerion maritima]|uniref:Uncharacterized protein n=1 Tax=Zalerion maritima TaxID=339359 RepID=A0AAD5RNB5_9PEZI|nr:hypothetical protein MKZ38_002926 [Zalerion maritima]
MQEEVLQQLAYHFPRARHGSPAGKPTPRRRQGVLAARQPAAATSPDAPSNPGAATVESRAPSTPAKPSRYTNYYVGAQDSPVAPKARTVPPVGGPPIAPGLIEQNLIAVPESPGAAPYSDFESDLDTKDDKVEAPHIDVINKPFPRCMRQQIARKPWRAGEAIYRAGHVLNLAFSNVSQVRSAATPNLVLGICPTVPTGRGFEFPSEDKGSWAKLTGTYRGQFYSDTAVFARLRNREGQESAAKPFDFNPRGLFPPGRFNPRSAGFSPVAARTDGAAGRYGRYSRMHAATWTLNPEDEEQFFAVA